MQTKEDITYDGAYLQVTADIYSKRIPLKITFEKCQVERAFFENQSIAIRYEIGSGAQTQALP